MYLIFVGIANHTTPRKYYSTGYDTYQYSLRDRHPENDEKVQFEWKVGFWIEQTKDIECNIVGKVRRLKLFSCSYIRRF